MRIAVTGSNGFVGAAAVAVARSRGHAIVRVLRPGESAGAGDVVADLADVSALEDVASRVDAVLHCAASDDPRFLPVSRQAATALMQGLPAEGRFAMQGGSAVFGDTGKEAAVDPDFAPPPPLAARADFERFVLDPPRADLSTRVVYGSLVCGGRGAAIPSAIIDVAKTTGAVLFPGTGEQLWSGVHVDDFGKLLVDAVETAHAPNSALFAAGRAVRIRAVAEVLGDVLGTPVRAVASEAEASAFGMFAGVLATNQHFSSARARERFGWRPDASDEESALFDALVHQASRSRL